MTENKNIIVSDCSVYIDGVDLTKQDFKEIITAKSDNPVNISFEIDSYTNHLLLRITVKYWFINIDVITFDISSFLNQVFKGKAIVTDNRTKQDNSNIGYEAKIYEKP